MNWHSLEIDDVLSRLDSGRGGLSAAEAGRRLLAQGPNRLPPPPRRPAWRRLAAQFNNVLILVLLATAAGTALLGHTLDTAVILGVVLLNALIGHVQEGKAERALEAVGKLLSPQAMVVRGGERKTLDADQLVPGDVVFLQSGDRVPADMRLILARKLRVEEAMLTGESLAVHKQEPPVDTAAALGDRRSMAYSGTLVASGQALGVVTGTGADTEIGRISAMLGAVEPLATPLTRQMARFARTLTLVILVVAVLAAVFGVLARGYALDEMFLAAVGLAVAAIPEGLPAIITITMAIGVQRMARKNAIIRRLPAVETLGSVSIVCSDKTGTLTRNEMTVQTVETLDCSIEVSGTGYDPHGTLRCNGREVEGPLEAVMRDFCLASALCNDASLHVAADEWRISGDPMEAALVVLARKGGFETDRLDEQYPRMDVIPFESEHRFMATLNHDHHGRRFIVVKGASEAVFGRCSHQRSLVGDQPFESGYWASRLEAVAAGGQRTLVVAIREADPAQETLDFDDVRDLVMLGIAGITDPPRVEAIDAVAQCQAAGIRVKMITGDHATTATAIAARLGIGDGGGVCTGAQLDAMDEAAFREAARTVDVFARASPENKLRLVDALQADGAVVAMTGDGVNDAPALKQAGVGVAMGLKGTEVTREAAEMVLADDNFASIMHAVREGRTVYDNIKKSILFILPTNGGEALTLLAAIALGQVLPVTALQILWVNMITAVTLALALAFEPAEPHIMRRPPRDPGEPLLSGFMAWRILMVSVLMVAGTLGLFLWQLERGGDVETARTVAVNTLVVAEIFYLFNARFITRSVLCRDGLLGNPLVLYAIGFVIFVQLGFTYLEPVQLLFDTRAIDPLAWLAIGAFGVGLFLFVEAEKALTRKYVHARRGTAPE